MQIKWVAIIITKLHVQQGLLSTIIHIHQSTHTFMIQSLIPSPFYHNLKFA